MKQVMSGDAAVLELKSGVPGCLILFGLPVLFGGLAMVAFATGIVPGQDPPGEAGEWLVALVVGVVFALVGGMMVGGRRGVKLDQRSRVLVRWWGLFVPFKSTEQPLQGFGRVTLSREIRRSDKSTTTVYPVRIEGSEEPVDIWSPNDYQGARRVAEQIAKHMSWPMADSSTGETVVREAQYLDESVRDRLRRTGERLAMPAPPHTMRSTQQSVGQEMVFTIPAPGGVPVAVISAVVALVPAVVAFVMFGGIAGARDLPEEARAIVWTVIGVVALVSLVAVIKRLRGGRGGTVRVSSESLDVTSGGRRVVFPSDELEELSLARRDLSSVLVSQPDGSMVVDASKVPADVSGPAGGPSSATIPAGAAGLVRFLARLAPNQLSILARSDRASVHFGRGLDHDELAYIYAAILRALAG